MWRCVSLALLAVASPALAQEPGPAEQQLALGGPRFLASTAPSARTVDPGSISMLQRRVTLTARETTLGESLKAMTQQTGVRFLLSQEVVALGRPVRVQAAGLSLAAALTELLLTAEVDVAVVSGSELALVRRHAVAADTGAIAGRVTDRKSGVAIPGATVLVEGTKLSATTGNDGRYRIGGVAVGTYQVRARFIGYAPGSTSAAVGADREVAADFALEKSAQRLDEVVTTGTVVPTEVKALPTPVTVVTDSDIAQQRPHSMQELLRQAVPTGVSWDFAAAPSQMNFSVRGASTLNAGGVQTKVFVDGLELARPTISEVDPNDIERIEVIRGPQAAAIYGSDAIGGVIQIFTKRGTLGLTRPQVDAEAAFGVIQTPYAGYGGVLRQTYKGSVHGGGSDVSYSLGAGYSHTDDFVPSGDPSRQSNPSVYGGMHFARGVVAVDVSGRYQIQINPLVYSPALRETGFVTYSKPFYERDQFENQAVGARLSLTPIGRWTHTVTVGFDRVTEDEVQTHPRLRTAADTLLFVFNRADSKAQFGYTTSIEGPLGRSLSGSMTAGVEHYSAPLNQFLAFAPATAGVIATAPDNRPAITHYLTNNTGYFAQAQVGFRDALFFTGGLRAEQNTDFGDSLGTPISPRVGLSYARSVAGAVLKVRGSWGRALRPPAHGDKVGQVGGGSIVLANPTLGPERQHGWDAGVDAVFGTRGSLSLTYYNQTAEDLIEFVTLPVDTVPTFQNQNVGRVQNTGVEVEAALLVGSLQVRGQYGYARARVEQLGANYTGDLAIGDQTLATPKHTAGASLAFAPRRGMTVAAGMTYMGSYSDYDYPLFYRCLAGTGPCEAQFRDYIVAYPSFLKMNATIWQQIAAPVSAFVSVDNLTNNVSPELLTTNAVMGRITTVGLRLQY